MDSIATLVTPQALNQSARLCRSCVNVPKERTGSSVQAGFTAAMCILDPMSMAAAPTLTSFSSGRSPVVFLGMAVLQSMTNRRVWAMPIVIFLIGIAAGATSPLSSSHAPMDHVF